MSVLLFCAAENHYGFVMSVTIGETTCYNELFRRFMFC